MKNFDRIERYLNGEMSESEKEMFEQAMEQDAALAEEVRLQRFEESAIDLMIEDDFIKKIAKIATEEKEKKKIVPLSKRRSSSSLFTRWIQLAAAACVLIVVVSYIYSLNISELNHTELAINAYKKRLPNFSTIRSTDLTNNNQEYDKYSAYITNNDIAKMEETIEFFKKQEKTESQYRAGHACLLYKDFGCAIQQFNIVLKSSESNSSSYRYLNFYLALAYLGNDDMSKAKSMLEMISNNSNDPFRVDAKQIIEKLE